MGQNSAGNLAAWLLKSSCVSFSNHSFRQLPALTQVRYNGLYANVSERSTVSHLTDLDSNRKREQLFLIRSVCLIGAIVYVAWSGVYQFILPGAKDTVSARMWIGGLAVFNILLTYVKLKPRIRAATPTPPWWL